jgi:hypothetical protein
MTKVAGSSQRLVCLPSSSVPPPHERGRTGRSAGAGVSTSIYHRVRGKEEAASGTSCREHNTEGAARGGVLEDPPRPHGIRKWQRVGSCGRITRSNLKRDSQDPPRNNPTRLTRAHLKLNSPHTRAPCARAPTSPRMSSHLDSRLGQSRAHIPFWPDDDPGFSRLINSQDERGADNRDNMRDNCSHTCSQCPLPIPPGFLLLSGAGPPKTFLSSSADTYLGSSF